MTGEELDHVKINVRKQYLKTLNVMNKESVLKSFFYERKKLKMINLVKFDYGSRY